MKRRLLIGGTVAVLGLAIGIAVYAYDSRPTKKRGSASVEFNVFAEPEAKPAPKRRPWPTYGFDPQRTHVADDFDHRPPYRRVWHINGHDTLEFPPSVGYDHVYLAQQKGLFFALDADTGKVAWKKNFKRCAASSPTLANGLVYQAYMDFTPCPEGRPGATGFMTARDAKTGRQRWRFNAAPIESSPLLRGRTLYFGSWDHRVYAIDAMTGRKRWSFQADDQVNTSGAYSQGTVYIASDGGTLYALSARTGRLRWSAQSNASFGSREFFYATPTVRYGRVFIGNTDGTMYVYGAKTGKLRWARPLGTYIYSAAAVSGRRVFVGTYDGSFYALDAATGDVRWKRAAAGAVHGAPTVMQGLVYYSTCNSCGSAASRAVKRGPGGTYALDARTGKEVWRFRGGKYANPVVADSRRVYVTGQARLFAFVPRQRP